MTAALLLVAAGIALVCVTHVVVGPWVERRWGCSAEPAPTRPVYPQPACRVVPDPPRAPHLIDGVTRGWVR